MRNIADYFKSQHRKVDQSTIYHYLNALSDAFIINREFAPLLTIKDQYPKYVVTMDDFWQDNIEGVRHVYLPDFLLGDY